MLLYMCFSLAFVAFDIFMAVRSFARKTDAGRCMGIMCALAGTVNLFYIASVFAGVKTVYSILSSLYFGSIDLMLTYFYYATRYHTGMISEHMGTFPERFMLIWTAIDLAIVLTNPLHGLCVGYEATDGAYIYPKFIYILRIPYYFHLTLAYMYIAFALFMLSRKAIRVPENYRRQYQIAILLVLAVVALNCVFLFVHTDTLATDIDWSLFGYSIAAFALYWSFFEYSRRGMREGFKNYVFDHIDSGMVMFDYNGNSLLVNHCAQKLLPEEAFGPSIKEEEFARICGITLKPGSYSEQVFISQRALRCDVEEMLDKSGRKIGRSFSFKDIVSDTDLLTGFQEWESFARMERSGAAARLYPAVCMVLDINALKKYNSENGRGAGDRLLKSLSEQLRAEMPANTHFVRGKEAELIAICTGLSEADMSARAEKIRNACKVEFEYSMSYADGENVRLTDAIDASERGLKVKKLLNRNTSHSENLISLIKALEECDPDTEEHVKRTRIMGEKLGRRLKLSDVQLSDLSLLCLMHDIGKIAIPLEILNKPGKLTASEWNMMKTHVQKGYQIALSNSDTKSIADMILHHHERWDGTGYPDKLKGEAIPILSRIISAVDAFDAMVNDRVYRKALSVQDAIAELERCSGTQFDPIIIQEFTAMLRESGFTMQTGKTDKKPVLTAVNIPAPGPDRSVYNVLYARYRFDDTGIITDVYDGFEALTGYSSEYIKTGTLRQFDLIPEEDREEYLSHIARDMKEDRILFLEHRLRRRDGRVITVLCYGKQYYDSSVRAGRSEIVITETAHTHEMSALLSALPVADNKNKIVV